MQHKDGKDVEEKCGDAKERWERCRREMWRCNIKMERCEDVEDDVE
jgi:hypothetical protein